LGATKTARAGLRKKKKGGKESLCTLNIDGRKRVKGAAGTGITSWGRKGDTGGYSRKRKKKFLKIKKQTDVTSSSRKLLDTISKESDRGRPTRAAACEASETRAQGGLRHRKKKRESR